ncbi:MAG: hypothetical protein LBR39_03995 [Coriobacteriales bacterium]|nr:hypothetical protein [Coriobacteriales bacterium]
MQLLLSLALALACGGLATGCGGGHAGLYSIESVEFMGESYGAADLEALAAATGTDFSADSFYLELKSNGDFIMATGDSSVEGTYEIKGNALTLEYDSSTVSGNIDGNQITISESGTTLIFKK